MDRNQESRCSVNEPALLSLLDAPNAAEAGSIRDMSDEGIRVATASCLSIGSRIQLQCKDWVLVGTVINRFQSKPQPGVDACDSIGIRIEHMPWRTTKLSIRM
jgi:hypothetical protein